MKNIKNKIIISIYIGIILIITASFLNYQHKDKQQVAGIQEIKLNVDENDMKPDSILKDKEVDINDQDWVDCSCEKTFQKQYPIEWSGNTIATFNSGGALGVERFDKDAEYKQFYVTLPDEYIGKIGFEPIRVTGKLIGITCGYANTVFGECVADVVADSIEKIN